MRTRIFILTGLAALWSSVLFAQPPAPPTQPPPPPPPREGTAEFAFVGTSGNSSTQSIGLGGDVTFRPAPWTFNAKAAYVRNESEDVLKAESVDFAFKAARAINPRLSAFGRYGFLHDRFAGIDARNTIEGGLSYIAVNTPPHLLTVDASLGYAHESRLQGDNLSNPLFATGALYKLKLSDAVVVSDDLRLVFSLSNGDDWRTSNIAAVTSKLTTILSLKVSNTVRYVNAPVPGFQTTDTITAIALVAKF
jgi:putative salt-induced outer membrane protein